MMMSEHEMSPCQTCALPLPEGSEGWCDSCYSAWQVEAGIDCYDWAEDMSEGVA
jgi:hypothetical protein